MNIKPIKTKAAYAAALKTVEGLTNAKAILPDSSVRPMLVCPKAPTTNMTLRTLN